MVDRPPLFPRPDEHVLPEHIHLGSPPLSQMDKEKAGRFIGSIVGLATCDALGASVEFRPHDYFISKPVRDMQGGGTWGLRKGQWTDDTSMALCLASSLITKRGYDPYDQMVRYKWWYHYGYLSSTGKCFDIGNATRKALDTFSERQRRLTGLGQQYEKHVDDLPWEVVKSSGKIDINCSGPGVAGNGALMRLAPLPLFFYKQPELAVEYAGQSARLTHGDPKAVDACRYYAALIVAAVNGESKKELLSDEFYKRHQEWFGTEKLHKDIARIAEGSFKRKKGYKDGIRGTGYVVNTIEAALWAFWSDDGSFEHGALAAVNLGDDTDTTAAIYGQLAGAHYGLQAIPPKWTNVVYARELLTRVGEWLCYYGIGYRHTGDGARVVPTATIPHRSHTRTNYTEDPLPSMHSPHESSGVRTNQTNAATTGRPLPNLDTERDQRHTRVEVMPNLPSNYSSTASSHPDHHWSPGDNHRATNPHDSYQNHSERRRDGSVFRERDLRQTFAETITTVSSNPLLSTSNRVRYASDDTHHGHHGASIAVDSRRRNFHHEHSDDNHPSTTTSSATMSSPTGPTSLRSTRSMNPSFSTSGPTIGASDPASDRTRYRVDNRYNDGSRATGGNRMYGYSGPSHQESPSYSRSTFDSLDTGNLASRISEYTTTQRPRSSARRPTKYDQPKRYYYGS